MFLFLIPVPIITTILFAPFMGTLVRYRANYEPKRIELDGQNSKPLVNGYFAMLKRVYEFEGWSGLYKGSMWWLISQFLLNYLYANLLGFLYYALCFILPLRVVIAIIFPLRMIYALVLGIPITTILCRAICTPYALPSFSPRTALSVLLSPTERRRPWKLYFTPGLLILHTALNTPIKAIETSGLLLWEFTGKPHLIIYIAVIAVMSIILSPLPVMIVRLSLQRNHDLYDGDPLSDQPRTEAAQAAHLGLIECSKDEEILGLRDEDDPYTSLYNCFTRMYQEEGWTVFYRAYWATFFGQTQWLWAALVRGP